MSWYSNILTNTTSRINNLQRSFLGGETDGDTEDDTHVCRVLRNYYTEKGRPFPGWLPPDPKAPPPAQPVLAQQSGVGSRYGGLTQQGGGSLSSLWDNNPVSQPQDSQSLRQGRGAPPPMRRNDPRANPNNPFNSGAPGAGGAGGAGGGRDDVQARPLPSQRAGSYQSAGSAQTPPAGSGAGSAQDRLRQRLWGGSRTASPAAAGPFNPPPQQSSSKGGGSMDDYESRFSPGGMYDATSNRGGDKPFMAANSPWASDESQMYGGGGGGGSGSGRSGGLPGGNRRAGLPSGPRMR